MFRKGCYINAYMLLHVIDPLLVLPIASKLLRCVAVFVFFQQLAPPIQFLAEEEKSGNGSSAWAYHA